MIFASAVAAPRRLHAAALACLLGCAAPQANPPPVLLRTPRAASTPRDSSQSTPVAPRPTAPPARPAQPRDTADPATTAEATKIAGEGVRLYHEGEYDKAEKLLNQALTLHPFLPLANLTLGKILLMRGEARSDEQQLASAKRMLEMALALDPSLREAATLLELWKPARID